MIPKKIHYCWFGGNPIDELGQKCLASWKKYCPDYEIIEWNESNFDINSNSDVCFIKFFFCCHCFFISVFTDSYRIIFC